MQPTVLFEDADVVAVDKPAGVVVIPAREEDPALSLRHALEAARGEKLWVVHRIDRDTSGVVLFARNADAHRALSVAFERREVEKGYLALTRGAPKPPNGTMNFALHTARKGKMRPAHKGEADAIDAVTDYATRATWTTPAGAVALVEALPRTGRQHQIRVHLRAYETPLLVDPLYGRAERVEAGELGLPEGAAPVTRLTLHAAWLSFPHAGGTRRVEAPLAPDLAALVAALEARVSPPKPRHA